jgi:signal transduction histidine kinase
MRIRHISTRFALLLASAAVIPLLAYGGVSIVSLQRGTRESIVAGNLNVATRAAAEIRRYVVTNAELLKALAADLQDTGLSADQQDRILKNYILQVREFRELTLLDEDGRPRVTSRVGTPRARIPQHVAATFDDVTMSDVQVDEDLLPTAVFAIHLKRLNRPAGWLVGEFSLEEMWRMVDRIRIGDHGFALVVAPNGALIAHGDPDKKALVAQAHNMRSHPLVQEVRRSGGAETPFAREYPDDDGPKLGVAAPIAPLGWTVLVEQPTREAFASARQLERLLVVAISIVLIAMIATGYFFGRQFLRPIRELQRGTQAVAGGDLETRVDIHTGDEFSILGAAFNTMANRLVELQENIKRQERHAMFGRVAAGLVHDIATPIQTLGNAMRLLVRDEVDLQTRRELRETIDRELSMLRRFLDDLRNAAKPRPIEKFPVDVNASVREILEPLREEGARHGVAVELQIGSGPLIIAGDRFALGRVYRNLVTNAIQATQTGGRVLVATARQGDRVEVTVADTGSGIDPARLGAIFDEFVTTKRRGLGLGLAITKRIVEQLEGTISVESELGKGTTFTLRFPARDDLTVQAEAS